MGYERLNLKTGQVITEDVFAHLEDGIEGAANAVLMTPILYTDLVSLRDAGQLKPGMFYRITDYVTTTTQENTQSAGHQFDIIVLALSESKLSEQAYAAIHEGDTYFTENGANLSAWKIWYCLDNDSTRFAWADAENGKGVIYRMIDEWNNDCPYDFKNILFERRTYEDGELEKTKNDGDILLYCYTFSWLDEPETVLDLSIYGNNGYVYNDESASGNVRNNKISPYCNLGDLSDGQIQFMNILNNIVFLSTYYYDGRLMYGCYGNYFDNNCKDISINNNCQKNKFSCECRDIWLASDCTNNTFGQECYEILLGTGCFANTFGSYTKIQILDSAGELINGIVGCSFGNYVNLNIELDVTELYPFRGVIVMPNVSGKIHIQLSETNLFIAADSDGKPFFIIANQFKN